MNRLFGSVVFLTVVAAAASFIGTTTASAKRAEPDRGQGCYVRTGDGPFDFAFDATCEAKEVTKLNEDNTLDFFVYQDHGQTSWRPATAYRESFEQCINFGGIIGVVCGTAKETVTPSGEYKSSFKSY
ncbi:MAG: hypothetical protein ABI791_07245 [Acidobacteriota bacterium]